jgi:hypothetical protein
MMKMLNQWNKHFLRCCGSALASLAILAMLAINGFAAAQATFPSAAEAIQSLFQAVQSRNEDKIGNILGGPSDLLSSNNEVQDEIDRGLFVQKYQEMHRLSRQADGSMTLYVGAENWPFPIPLIEKDGSWRFDPDKGRDEILFRRIGENELFAIATCREFVDAEKRYRADLSTRTVEDSSAASLAAKAAARTSGGASIPLHGYYFRLLPRRQQAKSFVFIAYPVEYRSSGVMTFVVTERGVVYEKDLGPNTSAVASSMEMFHKDATWSVAEE